MKQALGIDVGGTKICASVINEKGEIITEIEKYETPKSLNGIKDIFKNIISKYENDVTSVAFATAGAVNNECSKVISSTGNLVEGYRTIEFTKLSNKPVYVENDANAAAWAEHIIGASKGMANSIMLTLGTGVGGGIILNNKLYKGKSGSAGEMHFKMYPDKRRHCTCGSYDCFEAYASGTGLKITAEEMLNDKNVTTYDVINGLKANDKKMTDVFNKWQNDILMGTIGLCNIFDPDCVVFSGSMAQFIDTDYIEKETNSQIVTQPTKILKAQAGNYSGMIGAALLALGVNS